MNNYMLIKDFAKVTNGKSDVKDAKENGKYVFFDRSILNKKSDKFLFDTEAIIIPGEDSREIFEPRFFNGKFDLHQRCYVIYEFSNDVYAKYIFYKLKTLTKHFANVSVGTTVPSLRLDHITDLKMHLPSISIQKKIADLLFSLDSKIEVNKMINYELEQVASKLFNYWFVDFNFPNKNGDPYRSNGGRMVWDNELKREIPDGWKVCELGNKIKIQRGISYTSKDIFGKGVPMINLNSFNLDGTYKFSGIKTYSGKFTENNVAKPGDLLIAATDVTRNAEIIGKSILVPNYYHEDLVFSMDIAKIQSNELHSSFLLHLFNSKHYHNYIKWYATGTLVLHLNLEGINKYKTELPSNDLLDKFDKFYRPISEKIQSAVAENQLLLDLKNLLLPLLMNEQVKVK